MALAQLRPLHPNTNASPGAVQTASSRSLSSLSKLMLARKNGSQMSSSFPASIPSGVGVGVRLGLEPGSKSADILLKLRSKKATGTPQNDGISTKPKLVLGKGVSLGKFTLKKPQVKPVLTHESDIESLTEKCTKSSSVSVLSPPELTRIQSPWNEIKTKIHLDGSKLLLTTNSIIPIAPLISRKRKSLSQMERESQLKRHFSQLLYPLTNLEINVETIAKAKTNFSRPSPDDKILQAQNDVFNKDMKNLKISKPVEAAATAAAGTKDKHPPKPTKPFKKIDLVSELSSNKKLTKPHKSFVVIGHIDAGKSTLMGRLLFDLGVVDAKTVNKLVREAEKSGKGSFALAWIMDQTSEERSRGVTVDICATSFDTTTTRFTAIDAPGHKDFVPQMISGVSQADLALLVIDSINGEFEAGFFMDGQTKEHTLLARSLGIEKICVVVNKMDKENWSQDRFEEIKTQLLDFLTGSEVGFSSEQVDFVPISGLTGVNVVKNDHAVKAFDWYQGPTLVNYLESVGLTSVAIDKDTISKLSEEDFNLAINDIFEVSSSEFGVTGKVSRGLIQTGETVMVSPTKDYLQIQKMLIDNEPVDVAISGEIATIHFKLNQLANKSIDELVVGDLISKVDSPISSVKKFTCDVDLFNMSKPLLVGTPFVLFRNNRQVPARISEIIEIKGSKKKKKHLVSKQQALVVIEVNDDRLLPITKYSDNKVLGRIVIRREGSTIGAGLVTEI